MSDDQPKEFFTRLLRGERKSETTAEEEEASSEEKPQRAIDPSQGASGQGFQRKTAGQLLFDVTHPPY